MHVRNWPKREGVLVLVDAAALSADFGVAFGVDFGVDLGVECFFDGAKHTTQLKWCLQWQ